MDVWLVDFLSTGQQCAQHPRSPHPHPASLWSHLHLQKMAPPLPLCILPSHPAPSVTCNSSTLALLSRCFPNPISLVSMVPTLVKVMAVLGQDLCRITCNLSGHTTVCPWALHVLAAVQLQHLQLSRYTPSSSQPQDPCTCCFFYPESPPLL
jgi:hypothetical protein